VPGDVAWVDVTVSAGHPRWEADVGRSFSWLGDVWSGALARLGLEAECQPPVGRPARACGRERWWRSVCFAGLGSGEVSVGGRKVVGISQRRTRAGSLFSCAALVAWRPADLVALLALGPDERARATDALAAAATGVGGGVGRLEEAFLDALAESG
jgi:lipoate-protein ligase A